MPLLMRLTVGGSLVEAHRVWERCFEQVVVPRRQTLHEIGQRVFLRILHLIETAEVSSGHNQRLKRPYRPKRYDGQKASFWQTMRLPSDSSMLQILAEQAARAMSPEITKRSQFLLEFVRQSLIRPDLAMWMWIARAHHLTAILEDLNGGDPVARAEFKILVSPGIDHPPNLRDTHPRDRQAVIRQEAYDTADAALRLRDRSPCSFVSNSSISGLSAAKSLSKTNVPSYAGCGPRRRAHFRGKDSNSGRSEWAWEALFSPLAPARDAASDAAKQAPILV